MINLEVVRDIGRRMSVAVARGDTRAIRLLVVEAREWGRSYAHVHPDGGYRSGVKYRMTLIGSTPLPAAEAAVKRDPNVDPWAALADLARGYENIELRTIEATFISTDPNPSAEAVEFHLCLFRLADGTLGSIAPSDVLAVEVID